MRRALALGRLGVGFVSPNPPMGAVVAAGQEVAGQGYHAKFGGPHGEVIALREAGERARGATLYVTLEPCCHHGKTPPCTKAILEAGIARVVYGAADPNPVAAGGVVELLSSGVEVSGEVLEAQCRRLSGAFLKHTVTGLPLVIAKWAMSLDGKIATRTGDSRWISNEQSRARAHTLRAEADAVLVGIGTVLADDPSLSCRLETHPRDEPFAAAGLPPAGRPPRQPTCVIMDGMARTPPEAAVLGRTGEVDVIVAVGPRAPGAQIAMLEAHGAQVLPLFASREGHGSVSPGALLETLGSLGIQSVLVEGGSRVLGSFLDAGLVDRVNAFVAMKIIGGESARSSVAGRGVALISSALDLGDVVVEQVGQDLQIEGILGAWDWGS